MTGQAVCTAQSIEEFRAFFERFLALGRDLHEGKISRQEFDGFASAAKQREMANRIDGAELAQGLYPRRMRAASLIWGYGDGIGSEMLNAWMSSGLLVADRASQEDRTVVHMALQKPAMWLNCLPQNPHWALATCEEDFEERGAGRWYLAKIIDQRRKSLWAAEHPKVDVSNFNDPQSDYARLLIERTESAGRLQTLIQDGRGAAWLMHALVQGARPEIDQAIAAGASLESVSPETAKRFFVAMISRIGPSSSFAHANNVHEPVQRRDKAFREECDRLFAADCVEHWEMWKTAIEAGLPKIDLPKISLQERYRLGMHARPRALAVLAQEALRDATVEGGKRALWVSGGSADEDWHPAVASLAGAHEGERAVDWALRHGLAEDGWTPEELECALSEVGWSGRKIGLTLASLAQAGLRIHAPDNTKNGLINTVAQSGGGQVGLESLLAMGLDLRWKGKKGRNLASELASVKTQASTDHLRALLDTAEAQEPGLALKMLEEPDNAGARAAHWAANALNLKSLKLCAEHGVDLNAQDNKGQTPMHRAARRYGQRAESKFEPLVSWFKEQGIHWGLLDKEGQTAIGQLAKKGPIEALAKIIDASPETLDQKDKAGLSVVDHLRGRRGTGEVIARVEQISVGQELTRARASFAGPSLILREGQQPESDEEGGDKGEGGEGGSGGQATTSSVEPQRKARRI